MAEGFPFVEIPEHLKEAIGKADPGTRIYRKDGPQDQSAAWFRLLSSIVGPTVSPGGVRMFCPVSRAAVHKRAKEGKLSMFLYHPTKDSSGLFGKQKTVRSYPYGYVPVSEAIAWRQELEERAIRKEEITREELEGAKADWDGKFLQWPDKKQRPGLREALEELGWTPSEVLAELAKMLPGKRRDGSSVRPRKASKKT